MNRMIKQNLFRLVSSVTVGISLLSVASCGDKENRVEVPVERKICTEGQVYCYYGRTKPNGNLCINEDNMQNCTEQYDSGFYFPNYYICSGNKFKRLSNGRY